MVANFAAMRVPVRPLALAATAGALFCGLAASMQADRLGSFDQAVRMGLHSVASPLLTLLAVKVTWLGSVGVISLFTALAVVSLMYVRRRGDAAFLTVTIVGALALENALKFWFHRVRPPPFFGTEPATYSFPSGHALLSLCFYGGLAIVATRSMRSSAMKTGIWMAMIFLVLVIGGTRIYLGVHYPSDVLGGYLVAITWVAIVLTADQRLAEQH